MSVVINGTTGIDSPGVSLNGSAVTATAAELNVLGGITAIASQAQAEAGTNNTTLMTPLRVAQALAPDYTSSGFTLTQNYRGTFAHGLGATPSLIVMRLRCVTAQFNFSVNDVVYFYSGGYDNGTGQAFQFAADTTNIYLGTYWTYVRNKTTGVDSTAWVQITYANWEATIVAWK